jgi:hypothetical protein
VYRSSAPEKFPQLSNLNTSSVFVQGGEDIRDYGLLVDVDVEDLSLRVDTGDTVGRLVLRSYKDSLARNTIHVYASTSFEIVEMN